MAPRLRTNTFALRAGCAALGLACSHCPPPETHDLLYEPVPLEAHQVKIAADADGDAKNPAHVAVFLQRGTLEMKGGAGHTLEGTATGATGDAPPRLELMQDRVALTQSTLGGTPPRGDAKFVLALGDTPMSLEVETRAGEPQTLDLGGVPLAKAHLHTETGHLTVDWTQPNPLPGGTLALDTEAGYIEVGHVARSGASSVDVSIDAGFVSLDLGDLSGAPATSPGVAIRGTVATGTLVVLTAKAVPALATVTGPEGTVVLKGWRPGDAAGTFACGAPGASPKVTVRVTAKSGHVELKAN